MIAPSPLPSGPLGLHVQLLVVGPTLRFALWLEAPPHPESFRWKGYSGCLEHPACFAPSEGPPFATGEAPWPRCEFPVRLPRMGNGVPVPLPGLVGPWVEKGLNVRSRVQGCSEQKVQGWLVPPSHSLGGLLHLLRGWRERYGDGLLAPQAGVVQLFLEGLKARLADGPLLPTAVPALKAPGDLKIPWPGGRPASSVSSWLEEPGLVPPVSLDELLRMRAELDRDPWLAQHLSPEGEGPAASVLKDHCPARFARFLVELLSATAVAATSPEVRRELARRRPDRAAFARSSDVCRLHDSHRSCLFPAHPVMGPLLAPLEHLHGVVEAHREGALRLRLGLKCHDKAFLPLESVARFAGAPLAERSDAVWSLPGEVAQRDWEQLQSSTPWFFCRPELLVDGSAPISADEHGELASLGEQRNGAAQWRHWANRFGLLDKAPRGGLPSFTLDTSGVPVRLRVRWDPVEVGAAAADTPALQLYRFRPALSVLVGEDEAAVSEVEAWLAEQAGVLVHAGKSLVGREELLSAVELAHARVKVLEKLMEAGSLTWARAVELDDEWAADDGSATESLFGAAWERFLAGLSSGEGVSQFALPMSFVGALRPYQLRGLWWLAFLTSHGFGACLADDMGLGKTVQVLALLLRIAKSDSGGQARPSLVVCPTSVVSNWVREAARFAPELRVHAHHGPGRLATPEAFREAAEQVDVVVTSYALARLDLGLLSGVSWRGLVVDEAHNLKNPFALQTRAIKSLPCLFRVGLTGTPVENHLGDLWSIFDFLNPGLLGGQARFARAFLGPMRGGDPQALIRLRRRVGPFMLRRTKDDQTIGLELPEKQEQDVECVLTREQRALYATMAEAALHGLVGKDGVERKAHVLAALLHLKQICNHPECFKEEQRERLVERSGKLRRCVELLSETVEAGYAALVFTQFRSMGALLVESLREALNVEVLYFHGALSAGQRDAVVAAFSERDGPPVLVLSLKAGGSGLNLTRASTVVHYDRWWNPAVERQATDRAHRLGQTQKVNVYRLVTRGTLEERIAAMLERKSALAEQVLAATNDGWVTEFDDAQLRAFLSLDGGSEEVLDG